MITKGSFKLCNSPLNWGSDTVVCLTPLSVKVSKKLRTDCQIQHVFDVNSAIPVHFVSVNRLSEYFFAKGESTDGDSILNL